MRATLSRCNSWGNQWITGDSRNWTPSLQGDSVNAGVGVDSMTQGPLACKKITPTISARLSKCEACSNFNWRGPLQNEISSVLLGCCYGRFAWWDEIKLTLTRFTFIHRDNIISINKRYYPTVRTNCNIQMIITWVYRCRRAALT